MELITIILTVLMFPSLVMFFLRIKLMLDEIEGRQYNLKKQIQELHRYIGEEHQSTRKETQELKTRATQDRKDLNDLQKTIEKVVGIDKK